MTKTKRRALWLSLLVILILAVAGSWWWVSGQSTVKETRFMVRDAATGTPMKGMMIQFVIPEITNSPRATTDNKGEAMMLLDSRSEMQLLWFRAQQQWKRLWGKPDSSSFTSATVMLTPAPSLSRGNSGTGVGFIMGYGQFKPATIFVNYRPMPTTGGTMGFAEMTETLLLPAGWTEMDGSVNEAARHQNLKVKVISSTGYGVVTNGTVSMGFGIPVSNDGTFRFPATPKEPSMLIAHSDEGFVALKGPFNKGTSLTLQPWGTLHGRLLDEGKPQSGVSLVLSSRIIDNKDIFGNYFLTQGGGPTDEAGSFTITHVPPSTYSLTSPQIEGVSKTTLATVSIKPGTNTLEVNRTGMTVRLTLKQPKSSTALIASAFAILSADNTDMGIALVEQGGGVFKAEKVPPGNYHLRARIMKHVKTKLDTVSVAEAEIVQKVTVPKGGTTEVNLGTFELKAK